MKVKIDVTQDDIDNGIPGVCSSCPVARAVSRGTNRSCMVHSRLDHTRLVDLGVVVINTDAPLHVFHAKMSDFDALAIGLFIKEFDGNEGVVPFSFEIESEYLK